ncbi:TIGR01777 family oxidoreductase [bacterium]|nr:TIGR01777 family oxidoreductase [bacterium]
MTILITGATGFVGGKLSLALLKNNHDLIVVGRSEEKTFREQFTLPCAYYSWDDLKKLKHNLNIDAVIHLAGASIAGGRWTKKQKQIIIDSRVKTTEALVDYFDRIGDYPKTFLSAAAIGYYPYCMDTAFDENSPKGTGFLSDVCEQWEKSSLPLEKHCRRVLLRFGLVFDPRDGFLKKMGPLFSTGLAGKIGHGKQWMSWVHIDDLVKATLFCLNESKIQGAINIVAPQAVTNRDFTQKLAKTLQQKPFLPVPSLALKLLLGEMSILALGSQKVISQKLLDHDFEFQYPDLDSAFKDLYAWHSQRYQQIFSASQWFDKPVDAIFPFFCEAKNLEKITPPLLEFKVLNQSTPNITKGTIINYKLKIHGVPTRWRTLIKAWEKNVSFTDVQQKGPYKQWEHTHAFEPHSKGTLMLDDVIYQIPFGRLGLLALGNWILKDIMKIFEYRKKTTQQLFD